MKNREPKKSKPAIMDMIERIENLTNDTFDHNAGRLEFTLPYSGRVTVRVRLEGVLLSAIRRFSTRVVYNTALGEGFTPKNARAIADDSVMAARLVAEIEDVVGKLSWEQEEYEAYIREATALLKQRQAASGYTAPWQE